MWTTLAFVLCTGCKRCSPRWQPCLGRTPLSASPVFSACPQTRCLFAQAIHKIMHRKVSQQTPAGPRQRPGARPVIVGAAVAEARRVGRAPRPPASPPANCGGNYRRSGAAGRARVAVAQPEDRRGPRPSLQFHRRWRGPLLRAECHLVSGDHRNTPSPGLSLCETRASCHYARIRPQDHGAGKPE